MGAVKGGGGELARGACSHTLASAKKHDGWPSYVNNARRSSDYKHRGKETSLFILNYVYIANSQLPLDYALAIEFSTL